MKIIGFIAALALLIGGYAYYNRHKMQVAEGVGTVVGATNAGIDAAIQTGMKGVAKVSPVYYLQDRNYGVSDTQNICFDSASKNSLSTIISEIQQHTKGVSCVADPDYPSRSFTITAPSFSNKGQYYCTDQSGFAGLIPAIATGGTFRIGVRCK
jgi:hypothetical protein